MPRDPYYCTRCGGHVLLDSSDKPCFLNSEPSVDKDSIKPWASFELSVRLRSCLERSPYKTIGDLRALTRDERIKIVDMGGAYRAALDELNALAENVTQPIPRVAELQDITYGPKVYFATLKLMAFATPDYVDHSALTPSLAHHARNGWRPVGVWTSGSGGTWVEVLLTRDVPA